MPSTQLNDIPTLAALLREGSRAALSQMLTLVARGQSNVAVEAALKNLTAGSPPVVALTGGGGVGKSSLLGALVSNFAERGERIGVLACDPESPVTGGALLGDRCRIVGPATSERVFVRSLAAPSGQQGIAPNAGLMLNVMKAYGFDRIFVETVGAGQGDIAVRWVADVVVLVLQPQTGDELQWEKAGVLEIADVVVVNKSDLPGTDQTVAELSRQLHVSGAPRIPIMKTSIARHEGIEEFCRVIESVQPAAKKCGNSGAERTFST